MSVKLSVCMCALCMGTRMYGCFCECGQECMCMCVHVHVCAPIFLLYICVNRCVVKIVHP